MYYTVYKITNLVNKKIYVGVHKTNNLNDDYMGSGNLIKSAIKKYGIENFEKEYISIFNNPKDMFKLESKIINEDFVKNLETYNIKEGGYGGFEYINKNGLNNSNDNYIKAVEVAKRSRLKTPERWQDSYRKSSERMIQHHKDGKIKYNTFEGRTHTDEVKKRISEANSKHQKGEGNSQFGTMWVHSLTEKLSRKIKKEEFHVYKKQGWIKGRKMKF